MAKPKEENVNIIAHIGNNKLNGIACRSKAPPSRVDKTHTPITVPANVAAEKSIWERLCVRGENHAMMNPSPPHAARSTQALLFSPLLKSCTVLGISIARKARSGSSEVATLRGRRNADRDSPTSRQESLSLISKTDIT